VLRRGIRQRQFKPRVQGRIDEQAYFAHGRESSRLGVVESMNELWRAQRACAAAQVRRVHNGSSEP
jgi:hypothetical protein